MSLNFWIIIDNLSLYGYDKKYIFYNNFLIDFTVTYYYYNNFLIRLSNLHDKLAVNKKSQESNILSLHTDLKKFFITPCTRKLIMKVDCYDNSDKEYEFMILIFKIKTYIHKQILADYTKISQRTTSYS